MGVLLVFVHSSTQAKRVGGINKYKTEIKNEKEGRTLRMLRQVHHRKQGTGAKMNPAGEPPSKGQEKDIIFGQETKLNTQLFLKPK